MTIQTYDLFEGTLNLGASGTALAVSSQVRNCRIEVAENVTTREAIPVLSGEEIPETSSETYTFTLAGTFLQDLAASGVIDWSWQHKGTEQEVEFVPSTAAGRSVSGIIKPVPLQIGGDVQRPNAGDPPTSDFSWRFVGEPDFGPVGP